MIVVHSSGVNASCDVIVASQSDRVAQPTPSVVRSGRCVVVSWRRMEKTHFESTNELQSVVDLETLKYTSAVRVNVTSGQ